MIAANSTATASKENGKNPEAPTQQGSHRFRVCLGCVVPTHGGGPDGDEGFERVCVEGPVMRAERLAW